MITPTDWDRIQAHMMDGKSRFASDVVRQLNMKPTTVEVYLSILWRTKQVSKTRSTMNRNVSRILSRYKWIK
jgi:hypothetical protein